MYNNFSSKKTKKVISALLASALVVTSAPITADAATTKIVGVNKTITLVKGTVTGLSKAEKKVVKVSKNSKTKKVTVKGLKAGKVSFKIGKKAYTVKVGATKINNHGAITLNAGEAKAVNFKVTNGSKDTIKFSSDNAAVATVTSKATASTKAKTTVTAVAAGTATITAKSANTGKKGTMVVTVVADSTTAAPATQDPSVTPDPNATQEPNATQNPNATTAPTATGAATTAPTSGGAVTAAPTATPATGAAVTENVVATVSAISILNLKEAQITFTDTIPENKISAVENTDNYAVYLSGATTTSSVAKATLSKDKKHVILLLTGTFENNKEANKIVVKKAIGLANDFTADKLVSSDVAIPQVEDIEAVGNKIVKIHLSEAVQSYSTTEATTASNYAVKYTDKNDTISAANYTATLSADLRTVTLTFTSTLASGNYTITVGNNVMKDFAGYAVPSVTKPIVVKAATKVAQATAIKVISRTVVDVTFDQEVTPSGSLTWKQGTTNKSTSTVAYSNTFDNNTLRFTFTSANVIAAGKVDFTVAGVTDAFSYATPEKTFNDETVVAEAAATASVSVTDDDTLKITFSKTMQNNTDTNSTATGDAANKANYKIVDANGKELDLTSVTATCDGTNVVLTKTDWNLGGNYTVSVSGVKDAYGSEMEALVNKSITVKDTTRPTISSTNATYSTTGNNIAFSFSEAMATIGANSSIDISNYQYSTDGTNFVSFPAGTTIVSSADGKSITITLPNTTLVSTVNKVRVGYIASTGVKTVADASGNILSDGSGNYYKDLTMVADSAPTFSGNIVVKDATTLLVPQTGFGSVEATDFQYTLDATTYVVAKSAKLVTVNGTNYIELGLNDTMSALTDRRKVTVRLNATTGYVYKSKSALGTVVTTGSASAPLNNLASWPFRATMKTAEVLNSKQIRITFDGLAAIDNLTSYLVIDNGTQTITLPTNVANYKLDGKNAVIITLDSAIDTTKTTVVKSTQYNNVASADWAKDANGIVYNECATGITATNVSDFIVNGIAVTDGTTTGILEASGDSIEIEFNQEPDIAAGTVTANIDANGIMTIAGVGTISGFRKATLLNNIRLTVDSKTLKIDEFSGAVGIIGSSLRFTPDATLKNKLGTAIKVETKSVDNLTPAAQLTPSAATAPIAKGVNADSQPTSVNDFIDFTNASITGSIPGTWSVESVVCRTGNLANYENGDAWTSSKAVTAGEVFTVSYKFTPSDNETYDVLTGTLSVNIYANAAAATLASELTAVRQLTITETGTEDFSALETANWGASNVDLTFTTSEVGGDGITVTLPDSVAGKYRITYPNAGSTDGFSIEGRTVTVESTVANNATLDVDYKITSVSDSEKTITGTITIKARNAE